LYSKSIEIKILRFFKIAIWVSCHVFETFQVLPIWEGTTNILSLDVLRAIGKSKGQVMLALHQNLTSRLQSSVEAKPQLAPAAKIVQRNIENLVKTLKERLVRLIPSFDTEKLPFRFLSITNITYETTFLHLLPKKPFHPNQIYS
jgi:hypothetical protein